MGENTVTTKTVETSFPAFSCDSPTVLVPWMENTRYRGNWPLAPKTPGDFRLCFLLTETTFIPDKYNETPLKPHLR